MNDTIRAAASAIAARDVPDGIEVLVLERGRSSRFLPGYVAFPGGATEAGDGERSQRWFGTAAEARRACAVRELVEEVSLVLTARGLVEGASLQAVDAAPPSVAQLGEIAHWVAPVDVPVRFDATFFAVRAHVGLDPRADGDEASDAWWASPRRLLDEWNAGRRRLYWPTYFTLSEIAGCGSVDELFALTIATREPDEADVARLPRSTFWQD